MMKKVILINIIVWVVIFLFPSKANAQVEEGIRVNVYDDTVRVYHNKIQLLGQGFNIYRDGEKINELPVQGVLYPEEFAVAIDDVYEELSEELNTNTATKTFLKLKTDIYAGRIATFIYPSVAKALGTMYTDDAAPIGSTVDYRIEFVNDLGEPTGEEFKKTIRLTPLQILAPRQLKAENTGESVTLSWYYPQTSKEADDQVIRFNVYRVVDNQPRLLNDEIIIRNNAVDQFNLNFQALETGMEEAYYVTAVDIAGHESKPSETIKYVVADNIPPQKVSGVDAIQNGDSVTVIWDASTDADLQGYNVYRSSKDISEGYVKINTQLIEPIQTFYDDFITNQGRSYFYKVAAVDNSGNEGEKSLGTIINISDVVPPGKVNGLSSTFTSDAVELQWEHLQDRNSYKSYIILRREKKKDMIGLARINHDNVRDNSYVDENITFKEGMIYQYAIIAVDSASNFSQDTSYTSVQIPDLTAPEPPVNVIASNKNGYRVNLRWNGSLTPDIGSYRVYKFSPGDQPEVYREVSKVTKSLQDTSVALGNRLVYYVTAIDSLNNESEPSVADTVLLRDFDAPRSVRNVRIMTMEDQVTINWEPVVAYDLAGYNVYKSAIATGIYQPVNQEIVETTELVEESVTEGMWYIVRAVDTSGNESKSSEPRQLNWENQ